MSDDLAIQELMDLENISREEAIDLLRSIDTAIDLVFEVVTKQ